VHDAHQHGHDGDAAQTPHEERATGAHENHVHPHGDDHDHGHRHSHDQDHHHSRGHDHPHSAPPNPYLQPRRTPEETAALTERVAAIEKLLIDKGLVSKETLDAVVETYEHDVGPMNGARVVARAWIDEDYKRRLLEDASVAIAELGYGGVQGEHMVVVENTPEVHNVVVCTLCSCYPWPVLGLPPAWYKSAPYRSRVVIDPRGVLREFGLEIDESVEVRVWDSSAEVRYLVLPQRPAGTEEMSEEQLAELVSRDAMIGVARVETGS
jgi:nitrile hydratase